MNRLELLINSGQKVILSGTYTIKYIEDKIL
jgi:hypothetical protein